MRFCRVIGNRLWSRWMRVAVVVVLVLVLVQGIYGLIRWRPLRTIRDFYILSITPSITRIRHYNSRIPGRGRARGSRITGINSQRSRIDAGKCTRPIPWLFPL